MNENELFENLKQDISEIYYNNWKWYLITIYWNNFRWEDYLTVLQNAYNYNKNVWFTY